MDHDASSTERAATGVIVACPECGEVVEVRDATALVLALHMQNACDVSTLLVHHHGEEG